MVLKVLGNVMDVILEQPWKAAKSISSTPFEMVTDVMSVFLANTDLPIATTFFPSIFDGIVISVSLPL